MCKSLHIKGCHSKPCDLDTSHSSSLFSEVFVNSNETICFCCNHPAAPREATPPPLTSSQLEAHSLRSEVANPPPPDSRLSQLVYQSDTRDQQTRRDLDSTHSSALDSTVVRYLNDRPALDALRPPSHATATRDLHREEGPEDRSKAHTLECPAPPSAENSSSSSPGSASQRLENLRRRQPDDKLEKLKERIRRQREHLEEAAERDGLLGYLDQPVGIAGAVEKTTVPTAKVRKVAAAPPAPIYKGKVHWIDAVALDVKIALHNSFKPNLM